MTREEAIQHIEALYPADSNMFEISQIGENLLEKAKSDIANWRREPTAVLVRYAELCLEEHGIYKN